MFSLKHTQEHINKSCISIVCLPPDILSSAPEQSAHAVASCDLFKKKHGWWMASEEEFTLRSGTVTQQCLFFLCCTQDFVNTDCVRVHLSVWAHWQLTGITLPIVLQHVFLIFIPFCFCNFEQIEHSSPSTAVVVIFVIAILLISAVAGVWLVKKYICGGRSVNCVLSLHTQTQCIYSARIERQLLVFLTCIYHPHQVPCAPILCYARTRWG